MESITDSTDLRKLLAEESAVLLDKAAEHLKEGTEALQDLDRVVREGVLELGSRVAAALYRRVAATTRSERDATPSCGACGRSTRFKQMRDLLLRTALTGSPIRVQSPYYVCDHCRRGVLWLREAAGLDRDGFTPTLREMTARAGALESFEPAASEVLETLAGVHISGSKVHTLCHDVGQQAEQLMEKGSLGSSRPLRPGEKLFVEVDGGMLYIDDGWHEVKLAVVFPHDSLVDVSKDRRELLERRVVYTLDDREDLAAKLYPVVEQYLPKDADGVPQIEGNVVVLGDGATWIRNLAQDVLPGAMILLDWYHMVEHVAEVANVLSSDETQRKRWKTTLLNQLRTGKIDKALHSLARQSMRLAAGYEAQKAVASLHRYLSERADSLRYAEARSQDLPIGSGVIESAVSHVLQQRLKRCGMRWRRDGAKAMSALRCAYRSTGGFEALFARPQRMAA